MADVINNLWGSATSCAMTGPATDNVEKTPQSILAQAFRGELVPTEAELARHEHHPYEPASVLVGRIKGEALSKTRHASVDRGSRRFMDSANRGRK